MINSARLPCLFGSRAELIFYCCPFLILLFISSLFPDQNSRLFPLRILLPIRLQIPFSAKIRKVFRILVKSQDFSSLNVQNEIYSLSAFLKGGNKESAKTISYLQSFALSFIHPTHLFCLQNYSITDFSNIWI